MSKASARLHAESHLAVRKDAPKTRFSVRADVKRAEAVTSSAESQTAALNTYSREKMAASSVGPQNSCLNTWRKYHTRWYGDEVPVYPLTVDGIEAVLTQMKAGGYRSVANYVSAAKNQHIRSGYPWTDKLELEAREGAYIGAEGNRPFPSERRAPGIQVRGAALR